MSPKSSEKPQQVELLPNGNQSASTSIRTSVRKKRKRGRPSKKKSLPSVEEAAPNDVRDVDGLCESGSSDVIKVHTEEVQGSSAERRRDVTTSSIVPCPFAVSVFITCFNYVGQPYILFANFSATLNMHGRFPGM